MAADKHTPDSLAFEVFSATGDFQSANKTYDRTSTMTQAERDEWFENWFTAMYETDAS